MEEAGIIVKEDEPTPWVSSMLVTDKRKVNDKRKDTPPSKDDVRICIDPRDLNKAFSNSLIIHKVNYKSLHVYHITCLCLDTQ